jgi:quinol monooxygenase YgiN
MVFAVVRIRVLAEKSEELRRALCSLLGQTGAQAGCTSCDVYQSPIDDSLRLESRWKTQNDLVRHIRSDTYRRLLLLMELGSEKPMIEFYTATSLRSWDLIEEARINIHESI